MPRRAYNTCNQCVDMPSILHVTGPSNLSATVYWQLQGFYSGCYTINTSFMDDGSCKGVCSGSGSYTGACTFRCLSTSTLFGMDLLVSHGCIDPSTSVTNCSQYGGPNIDHLCGNIQVFSQDVTCIITGCCPFKAEGIVTGATGYYGAFNGSYVITG